MLLILIGRNWLEIRIILEMPSAKYAQIFAVVYGNSLSDKTHVVNV